MKKLLFVLTSLMMLPLAQLHAKAPVAASGSVAAAPAQAPNAPSPSEEKASIQEAGAAPQGGKEASGPEKAGEASSTENRPAQTATTEPQPAENVPAASEGGASASPEHQAPATFVGETQPTSPANDQESAPTAKEKVFSFDKLLDIAQKLAAFPYRSTSEPVPDFLRKMDFDAWRDIRFRPEEALWKGQGLPFEIQFFHPGFHYDRRVRINIFDENEVIPLRGLKTMFDYGKNAFAPQVPEEIGFAGFRIHGPIKSEQYFDEIAVFLGASYLRAIGRSHRYGMLARGLAVATATPEGEEFPWFREFWIEKPVAGQKYLQVYALLDSPRITGAYAYKIFPGEETVMEVRSVVIPRTTIGKVGIAPLNSMFFIGENSGSRKFDDFRPEVHDSDGLQVFFNNGEWLWRPLQNPAALQLNSFSAPDVRGFGLVQRDRNFANYQDLEAHYEIRPGTWVEPLNAWGPGRLELVQIPTIDDIHDNIVAYWIPEQALAPHQRHSFDYRLRWLDAERVLPPTGYVVATRIGKDPNCDNAKIFVLDFEGETLRALPPDTELTPDVWAGEGGKILECQTFRNPVTGGWRLTLSVKMDETSKLAHILPDKRPPLELRAVLKHGQDIVSETWSYAFKP
ncbi:MAG: glucan biosynthesis protein [Deltaproteobacteria bacterium]|nr:glucan biosynthesis protein [Deltaproteobacteria bacterium]